MTSDTHLALRVALALLPVLLFLAVLVWLDSFRLVRKRRVLGAMFAGAMGALVSYFVNTAVLDATKLPTAIFAIVLAPFVEETLKGLWVAWQIRRGQVAFLVDAAIIGFATGAGFAIMENIYYLRSLGDVPLLVWLIRGLGTALMHGGTTAVLAVFLRGRGATSPAQLPWIGAVFLAALLHGSFNRFMTNPLLATAVMVVILPLLMMSVYRESERRLKSWLGHSFDRDRELLELIQSGEVHTTPLGRYLVSLREQFRSEDVADMLCLLRLQVELSIRAKGVLMLREQGMEAAPDPELPGKLEEVKWLEKRIGRAGLLAMRPICHWQSGDKWQKNLL
ncbi:MAG: RsiW-degrading membrane proteinase PrsW (M82 family) [Candidatus Krumholzibacteriia bacterium]|jgi:RsiW-degrading membrane proteinase PrsW (M82 family)